MDEGVKYDKNKLLWSLVPCKQLKKVVEVLTFGANKYSPNNWKIVKNAKQRYIDAAFRHLTDYVIGEKIDEESKIHHLAHCICCLLFIMWFDDNEVSDERKKI